MSNLLSAIQDINNTKLGEWSILDCSDEEKDLLVAAAHEDGMDSGDFMADNCLAPMYDTTITAAERLEKVKNNLYAAFESAISDAIDEFHESRSESQNENMDYYNV